MGESIVNLHLIHADTLLINHSNNRLFSVDLNATVYSVWDIPKVKDVGERSFMPATSSVYVQMTPIDFDVQKVYVFQKIYYKEDWEVRRPIFCVYDPDANTLSDLPLYYAEWFYKNEGSLGFLGLIGLGNYQPDKFLIYNFLGESNIYRYDTVS